MAEYIDISGGVVNETISAQFVDLFSGVLYEDSGSAPIDKNGTDTLNMSLTEVADLAVLVSVIDTLTMNLTENVVITVAIDPTDTLTMNATEVATVLVNVNVLDTANMSLADVAALLVAVETSETFTISISDIATILVALDTSDTNTFNLSEVTSLVVALGVSDTLTASLTESAAIVATASITDFLANDLDLRPPRTLSPLFFNYLIDNFTRIRDYVNKFHLGSDYGFAVRATQARWFDGKNIFKKTFRLNTASTPTAQTWLQTNATTFDTGVADMETCVKASFVIHDRVNDEFLPLGADNSFVVDAPNNNVISVVTGSPSWPNHDVYCVLEYTTISDVGT